MGFGRGIDAAPRDGVEVMAPAFGGAWRLATVTVAPGVTPRVRFDVPGGTPPRVALAAITDAAAHARALVTEAPVAAIPGVPFSTAGGPPRALRTLLGDARDLFAHVLERRYGAAAPPIDSVTGGAAASAPGPDVVVIHLGETAFTREVLRAVCAGRPGWNGDPARLDGDGYAILSVRAVDAPGGGGHLLVVGGSEYGTAFGVAALLERYFEAAWVFPGDDGEVIPARPDPVHFSDNVIDEPLVRSRSFAAMTSLAQSEAEIDASRSWQLRNRMRPGQERVDLYQRALGRRPDFRPACGAPDLSVASTAFHLATLEPEERVPSNHTLGRMLSPFLPPMVAEVGVAGSPAVEPRYLSRTSIYPDVRTREVAEGATTDFAAARVGMVHPRVGVLGGGAPSTAADPCDPATTPCCPVFVPFDQARGRVSTATESSHLAFAHDQFCGAIAETTAGVPLLRFIPRAFRSHMLGVGYPLLEWHPCVFEIDLTLDYGRPLTVRAALAEDLANQVMVALAGRELRRRDRTHALAFEDGNFFCYCDACARSDDYPPTNGALLFHRGRLICTARTTALECSARALAGRPGALGVGDAWSASGAAPAPLMTSAQWNVAEAQNPFARMSLDQLALRGVIFHAGNPSVNSLRLLSLANAVCRRLEEAHVRAGVPVAADGAFVPATERYGLAEARPSPVEEPVLSIFAYLTYVAPPIQSPAPSEDPGERCHRYLLPFMTGVRDTVEYAPSPGADAVFTRTPVGDVAGALERLRRWPDQFNQERWASAGARRIGLYEYLLTDGFLVPRLYTPRLRAALVRGERVGVRAFVAESTPAWGLSGATFWEWSRLLWNPTPAAADVRADYCARAFGAAAEWMKDYLDVCEAAWAATRDGHVAYTGPETPVSHPDRRTDSGSGSGYLGHGYAGRGKFLSQLAGWYERSGSDERGRDRLTHAWWLLNRARSLGGLDEGSRRRVGLVRRTFGFTLLIALWYRPLHEAFEFIRQQLPGDDTTARGRIQFPAGLLGQDETLPVPPGQRANVFLGQYQRNASGGAPVTVAGVVPRDDFARAAGMTTTVAPPVSLRGAEQTTLADAVRARIGTRDAPGIRVLRNYVHRYLALSGVNGFPPMVGTRVPEELDDLGFGLFSSAGGTPPPMMPDAALPDPGTMVGPHRMVGLYLPSVIDYVTWWNGVKGGVWRGASTVERPLPEQVVLVREDEKGIGWIFDGIKQMAAVILLYTSGLETGRVGLAEMKLAVMEG